MQQRINRVRLIVHTLCGVLHSNATRMQSDVNIAFPSNFVLLLR